MNVFIVTQEKYTEGNFGDLESNGTLTLGAFSTQELAQKFCDTVVQQDFQAQFGSAVEQCIITTFTLDVPVHKEVVLYACKTCGCGMQAEQPYCSHNCWQEAHTN